MCGIAGILCTRPSEGSAAALARMVDALRHRGPDAEGVWSGRVGQHHLVMGHTRLAIIDLSDAGVQPMFLPDGSHGIIYNGEVYNYQELAEELKAHGIELRSHCDTEVVLWALKVWGEAAFAKFNGFWALAWLDRSAGRLTLSRDRFGIKPLYTYQGANGFYFASEIKAILAASDARFAVNSRAAGRFIEQSLLDAQKETFFDGIEALPAGHNLSFDLRGESLSPRTRSYWTMPEQSGLSGDLRRDTDTLRETFFDAVRIRLRSDVPVGVLLSGGVDSSSIAAAMRQALGQDANLHAISATSDRPEFDEKPFVERMAGHLKCPVHYVELKREPAEWFKLLTEVIFFNDEPIGSFSTVAHYLLMQQARELGITVVLSGQGADELLCGYSKFLGFYIRDLLGSGRLPSAARVLFGFCKRHTVLSQFELSEAKRYLPAIVRAREIDIRGPLLKEQDFRVDVGLGGAHLPQRQREDLYRLSVPALVHYEDRSSMAFAREIRLPFLDYRLAAMLVPLAPELKLREGWTKWIFRKAMEPYLPASIVWRKDKQGFINPQGEWLKHELRSQVLELLGGEMLIARHGLIDQAALRRRYAMYCQQPQERGLICFKDIFNPIVMELWARKFASNLSFDRNFAGAEPVLTGAA